MSARRRVAFPFCLALFLSLMLAAAPASSQVIINEIMAAASDRLLQRTQPGYPKLGITTPWYMSGFNDAQWSQGSGPLGFGTFSNVTFGVNLSATMQNIIPALYVRKSFTATAGQAASAEQLQLTMRYNDGFIAFLNGTEVARRNMGNPGMFAYHDQCAFNTNSLLAVAETISLGIASNRLVNGTNLLCIQTHNKAITGSYANNLLCSADLRIGGASPVSLVTNTAAWRYFAGKMEPSGGIVDYGLKNTVPATASWATIGFNDSWWDEGAGPFGIEKPAQPDYALGVNLYDQVYGIASSIYSRSLFTASAAEAAGTNQLQLVIDYDDGLIVYLNGREVVRRNVGVTNTITAFDALASAAHNANGDNGGAVSNAQETVLIGPANSLLASGYNVLAIELHNASKTNDDMIARVTLNTTGAGARTLLRPEDAGRYFVGTREPFLEDSDVDADTEVDAPDSEGDWIELFNTGPDAVNLTGWSLTDAADKPRKWYFPAGSAIPGGGYLVVMATGFDVGPNNGATYLHTNFKLDSGGEYVGLVDAAGCVVSAVDPAYPPQDAFHSYARDGSGQFVYMDTGTPGATNAGASYAAITLPPVFSQLGGFYTGSFPLQLSAPDPAATIRYTTNGSEPNATNGAAYAAPVSITTNAIIRARCFKAGEIPSATVTHSFLIAQSAARRSLPAISIVGDPVYTLYGPNAAGGPANGEGVMAIKGGAYTNSLTVWDNYGDTNAFNVPILRGRCSEKPASFEFYPTNGVPLRTDLGLRMSGSPHARPRYKLTAAMNGSFSTSDFTQKPSFNIFFRGELGGSPQNYPFFSDSRVSIFEDMRIRAGKNDTSNPFIRDELTRHIYAGTGQEGCLGTFASIFINGVWKGYYNFCEHLREGFMQQHFNSTAEWDVQQVNEFASGDSIHWNKTIAYIRTNTLTNVSAYLGVKNYLDIDNFIDYTLVNAYAAMWDWPNNNWVASHERTDTGTWRFFMWDAEGGFGMSGRPLSYNSFTSDLTIATSSAKTTTSSYIPAIFTLLKVSPEFQLRYADRAQKHLFNNGCLTKNSMQTNYFRLRDTVNPIMKEATGSYLNESFYNTWIADDTTRRTNFLAQLVSQGFWPATLAPQFDPFGGTIDTNVWVSITNLNATGSVYYTTDGTDPRAPGGAVAGCAYAGPMCFPDTVSLKARVLSAGGEWSPLLEATFTIPPRAPLFQPAGNADWTVNANWSTSPGPYPNGVGAAAQISGSLSANRDINLRSPVTLGAVTFNLGSTSYRNRITDSGIVNPLTFQTTNATATLTVNGTGAGYVELEIDSDTVLASDLTLAVNSPTGNVSYGALRLKANWRGPGGLIKDGVGLASLTGELKSYTGATVIRQGVLQLTQPATPAQSPSVTVLPGGQLRLSSASTAGEPRYYTFGGDILLNSTGRGGSLPDVSGLGLAGGLRFDPESNDSYAVITNRIRFTGPSVIHVENARNTLSLAGPLLGNFSFTKTGGGNLILPSFSTGYYVPLSISNGTLTVLGRVISPVDIASGATLTGSGMTGPIHGSGTVALDGKILTTPEAIGLNYAFSFTGNAPAYGNANASGNGVLHLLSIHRGAAASTIDIYLDGALPAAGDCLRGGFFVECEEDLAGFLANATVRFFEPNAGGSQSFAGRLYSPYSGAMVMTVTAMPEAADFGTGPRQGLVMEIRADGAPVSYSEWLLRMIPTTSGDSLTPLQASPLTSACGSGPVNLLRYAFNIGPNEPATGKLPQFTVKDGTPLYSFRFDPGKRDLTYLVEASSTLTGSWDRVLFNSRLTSPSLWNWDGTTLFLSDQTSGPAAVPNQFYRLRIQLDTP